MNEYFISPDGVSSEGPLPETEIRRRLQVGELSFQAFICQNGWSKWEPILKIFPPADNSPSTVQLIEPPVYRAPDPTQPQMAIHPGDWICTQCNWTGRPVSFTGGSFLIELLLWLFLCLPGLIYSIWRLTTRRKVCPVCRSQALIPYGSPRAQSMR